MLLLLLIPIDAIVSAENVTINATLFLNVKQLAVYMQEELATFAENIKSMKIKLVSQFAETMNNITISLILATAKLDIPETQNQMNADGTVE